jgi:hypothetical protein
MTPPDALCLRRNQPKDLVPFSEKWIRKCRIAESREILGPGRFAYKQDGIPLGRFGGHLSTDPIFGELNATSVCSGSERLWSGDLGNLIPLAKSLPNYEPRPQASPIIGKVLRVDQLKERGEKTSLFGESLGGPNAAVCRV